MGVPGVLAWDKRMMAERGRAPGRSQGIAGNMAAAGARAGGRLCAVQVWRVAGAFLDKAPRMALSRPRPAAAVCCLG